MNIFFFGGTSLAARDLVSSLKKDYKVYVFSRKKKLNKNFYHYDLNKKNNVSLQNSKHDENYLFFFSSFVPLKEKKSTWGKCSKTNIFGLIELLKKNKVKFKKIVLASSCSVYGTQKGPLTEKNFLKPESYYAISKLAQENILRIFCEKNKIKFLCFRLGYIYGKNMNNKRIVKKIVINYKRNKKLKIFNKNLNLNLIHTQDIKEFILKSFKKCEGIFNLTNKYETKLIDFYNMVMNKKNKQKTKKNQFSSNKLTKMFPSIKFLSLSSGINELKKN